MIKIYLLFSLFISFAFAAQQKIDLLISNPITIQINDGAFIRNHDILIRDKTKPAVVPHRANNPTETKIIDTAGKYEVM